jgi:filamentous hemagglutinin family protein
MTGCAVAALLTALPRAASAQSFNGSPSVVAGDALVTTGPGTTNVDVFLPETVINWSSVVGADPNAIDFQPAGTTATFTGGPNIGDYTVLNRILPMSPSGAPAAATVAFNGTVNSSLFNDAPGGNIWFYSPTGIIVGPTATFNVGSLILTTDDIQFVPGEPDISNGSIYGPGGLVQFRGGSG